ncbi:MAG: hypothetical protein QNJ23_08375 [Woeseiaceae bacterium]|nr:hypothetical protein [Woeseiaceae bacterium]
MTSLTAIFGRSDEKPQEDSEKLLQLYWNRAELKKEFADLRNDKFRLQELIKEQEGATARVEQKLHHLEQLLLDPEWVYNVIIYYQLKHLNLRCQSKLEKFAEQLKQQREQRTNSQVLSEWQAKLDRQGEAIQSEIGEQRLKVQMLEDGLQAEQHRLVTMNGFVRFFRKRSMTARLDELAASIDAAHQREERLLHDYEDLQNQPPPETQGLDIKAKRTINFMILAYAQHLYLHFRTDGLVGLAKEAGDKSVGAINYGDKNDCTRIVEMVRKQLASLEKSRDFAEVVRQRARLIAEKAVFRGDDDAVPAAGSVATVYAIDKRGRVTEIDANLLGENYWNLADFVSR